MNHQIKTLPNNLEILYINMYMGVLFYGFQFTEKNINFSLQRKPEVHIPFLS